MNQIKYFIIISTFILLSKNGLFANRKIDHCHQLHSCYKQWFAGPLFTPNATTVDPKHPGIEPVIIVSNTYGKYDSSWHLESTPNLLSIIPYVDFQAGINEKIAFEIIALAAKNFCKGTTSTHFKDTILRIGYQIANDIPHSWVPDFRILLQETLPTGKYQKLNPRKYGTDCTGQGAYQTGFHLVAQKLFNADSAHPFRLRGDLGYFFQSTVKIQGQSFYGGDIGTSGIVHPGRYLTIFLFGEYALSRTWALACELNYQQGQEGRFSKQRGDEFEVPAFNQIIVFPEIQRTISKNSAIIIGGSMTIAGKNSSAFASALFAFLHIF